MEMNCSKCRFFVRDDDTDVGGCRYNAPLLILKMGRGEENAAVPFAHWPLVVAEDWCGQFQALAKSKKEKQKS